MISNKFVKIWLYENLLDNIINKFDEFRDSILLESL